MAVVALIDRYKDQYDDWGFLRNGYYVMIFLDEDGTPVPRFVHEINAEENVPNPNPKKFKYVIHKNGDYMDNRPENLEWSDKPETMMFEYCSKKAQMGGDFIKKIKSCYNCKNVHTQDPEPPYFHCDLHDRDVEFSFCCPKYDGDMTKDNLLANELWNHGKFWHARQLWEVE